MAEIVSIDAGTFKRIANAVKRVEAATHNSPVDTRQAQATDTVPIYNSTGAIIPAYGLVQLGALGDDEATFTATKPDYCGRLALGITTAEIPIDGNGRCWLEGQHLLAYDASISSGDSLAVGDRLGSQNGSHYAQWDMLGAYLVTGLVQDPDENDIGIARVVKMTTRGDNVVVMAVGGTGGPYQTVIWDANDFEISAVSGRPCVLRIDLKE